MSATGDFSVLAWTVLSPAGCKAVASGSEALMTADKSQNGNNRMEVDAGVISPPASQLWANLGSATARDIMVNTGIASFVLDLFFSANAPVTLTIADQYGNVYNCTGFPATDSTGEYTLSNSGNTLSASTTGKCVHMRLQVTNSNGNYTIPNSAYWSQHAPNLQAVALYTSVPSQAGYVDLGFKVVSWSVVPPQSVPAGLPPAVITSDGSRSAIGLAGNGGNTTIPDSQLWSGLGSQVADSLVVDAGNTPLLNLYFAANGPLTLTIADQYGNIYGCNWFPPTDTTGKFTMTSDGSTLSAPTSGNCVLVSVQVEGTGGNWTVVSSAFYSQHAPNLQAIALFKDTLPVPGYSAPSYALKVVNKSTEMLVISAPKTNYVPAGSCKIIEGTRSQIMAAAIMVETGTVPIPQYTSTYLRNVLSSSSPLQIVYKSPFSMKVVPSAPECPGTPVALTVVYS